jgi:hypothetical protein
MGMCNTFATPERRKGEIPPEWWEHFAAKRHKRRKPFDSDYWSQLKFSFPDEVREGSAKELPFRFILLPFIPLPNLQLKPANTRLARAGMISFSFEWPVVKMTRMSFAPVGSST